MKRVLVLHGHTENAHVFGRKFNDIRDALKDEMEFGELNLFNARTFDRQCSCVSQYSSMHRIS